MADITCKECGEPFSIYHLRHEREDGAYERMMAGDGCPACDWGEGERADRDTDALGNIEQRHLRSIFNSDDDPAKYL